MARYDSVLGKWVEDFLPGDPSTEAKKYEARISQAYKDKIAKLENDLAAYQKAYNDHVKENERLRIQMQKFVSLFSTCFCEHCRSAMLKWQGAGTRNLCVGCKMGKAFKRLVGAKKKIVRP